jgi:UDP-N-acetylmuramate dehydrogenase
MLIREHVRASELSTFRIGGPVRYVYCVDTVAELVSVLALAEEKDLPVVIVGEGSNTIWTDESHDVCAISLGMKDIHIVSDDAFGQVWQVDAGVNWDDLVERSVALGLSGIECLSGIPGSVGASPVQNIGAYGQEVKDVLVSVEVYDTKEKNIKTLSHSQCDFSYRDSIFKSKEKNRYIIVSILIKLSKNATPKKHYESLQKYLDEKGMTQPTLADIRHSVLAVRSTKLPDPKIIPNCGSFFENPIVTTNFGQELQKKYPDVKIFKVEDRQQPNPSDGHVKIPAGWLIEKAGLKGKNFGTIKVYENNALVLTNTGNATYDDLQKAKEVIVEAVKTKFGITLQMEPNVI